MNNLPESMYDYRPEREVEEKEETFECEVCHNEITETDHDVQSGMCEFCYRYEPNGCCEDCDERISQYRIDNFDSLCEDCEEEKQSD